MEATERALFESGVRHATGTTDGAALDSALDDLGWRDALEADRPAANLVVGARVVNGRHRVSQRDARRQIERNRY